VLQDKAEEIITAQTAINQKNFAADNAALVTIDNETGEILAMV
jgi:cell division protein FtsI/penicillin-binding protein 2